MSAPLKSETSFELYAVPCSSIDFLRDENTREIIPFVVEPSQNSSCVLYTLTLTFVYTGASSFLQLTSSPAHPMLYISTVRSITSNRCRRCCSDTRMVYGTSDKSAIGASPCNGRFLGALIGPQWQRILHSLWLASIRLKRPGATKAGDFSSSPPILPDIYASLWAYGRGMSSSTVCKRCYKLETWFLTKCRGITAVAEGKGDYSDEKGVFADHALTFVNQYSWAALQTQCNFATDDLSRPLVVTSL